MKMTLKNIVKEQIPPQVIISIIFVAMLAIGYGVWSQETFGTVSLNAPMFGTQVFIDGKVAGVSKTAGEKMTFSYSSGKHSIIVSRGDFFPWTKDFTLTAKETKTFNPFLIKKETRPSEIATSVFDNNTLSSNPEYYDTMKLFDNVSVKPELSALLAPAKIQNPRAVEYFPGRTDVLLIAVNDGIFALEIGSTTPINFQPLYKGTEPTFILSDNNMLIIKDGASLYRLVGYDK